MRVGRDSERKQELLLEPILPRSKSIQRDKEVWELPAVAKLTLHEHETLQRYVLPTLVLAHLTVCWFSTLWLARNTLPLLGM